MAKELIIDKLKIKRNIEVFHNEHYQDMENSEDFINQVKGNVKCYCCMYERGRYYFQLELKDGSYRYWSIKADGDNDKEFKNRIGLGGKDGSI